ncbi:hypothetical protein NDU88_002794 [Pleurodeles waltl]|uniref:Uncharacterized protein n=1 Tax=Pleurodeles waltl TaxID=8319 RepID=A0AAV7VET9_PLEWA|nr:hypothetical protein NDU88_002794 [Pleurodeles waltl]
MDLPLQERQGGATQLEKKTDWPIGVTQTSGLQLVKPDANIDKRRTQCREEEEENSPDQCKDVETGADEEEEDSLDRCQNMGAEETGTHKEVTEMWYGGWWSTPARTQQPAASTVSGGLQLAFSKGWRRKPEGNHET